MTLILINPQGASEEYKDVASKAEANRIISGWADPENLVARLHDEGVTVYEGPANQLK